jgi:uncharacterized protein (TIGR03083 family)
MAQSERGDVTMTGHMDKETMLRMVREGREELVTLLAAFDEAQMTEPHPPDGWSIKDVIAHIAFWENYALKRFRETSRGEKPKMLGQISEEEINRINQEALEAGRARTLNEVEADFQRAHQELLDELAAMPETQDDAWWAVWPAPNVPWLLIQYNTYDHYEEHVTAMREWTSGSK